MRFVHDVACPNDFGRNGFFGDNPTFEVNLTYRVIRSPKVCGDDAHGSIVVEEDGSPMDAGGSGTAQVEERVDRLAWFEKLMEAADGALVMIANLKDVGDGAAHKVECVGFGLPPVGFDFDAQ